VLFRGDFETGNISQWSWGAQCANYGLANDATTTWGNLFVVQDNKAQGAYAGRFDLPAAGTRAYCEVLRKRTLGSDGSDAYYALEAYYPANWQEPSPAGWGGVTAQLNYTGVGGIGPPVGLISHANRVNIALMSGAVNTSKVATYSSGWDGEGNLPCSLNCRIVPEGALTRGVWHQFIVHVRWASDSTGMVETWWKRKGESAWKAEAKMSGYPTLQWAAGGSLPSLGWLSSDHIGLYRGPASFPLSLWLDGFCSATTFAAAASCV
jgi:Polysaccharide lyase